MPEGDTVWLHAQRLHEALAGRRLTAAELRVPRFATAQLAGARVEAVWARGKHLLLRSDLDWTLHSHLGMEGSWRIGRPRGWPDPSHQGVRAVLTADGVQAVGHRLRLVELVPRGSEDQLLAHLGPDLLGPDWDPREALRRLREQPGRIVGEALLDQQVLAGIGNLYRSELLFLSGVTPWLPVGQLPAPERMVALAHRLLHANRHRWQQVTTGDTRPGRGLHVYQRVGLPCWRCASIVRAANTGAPPRQRVAFWCPGCQRGPAPPGSVRRVSRREHPPPP